LRLSFATHFLQSGATIRTVQALLGRLDVATKMIYTNVVNIVGRVRSPLDALQPTAARQRASRETRRTLNEMPA